MRNTSIVLNVILIIAVGLLYYLHFSSRPQDFSENNTSQPMPALDVADGSIVFINSDSLLENYQYYIDKKKEFEAKRDLIRAELEKQGDQLRSEIELYQKQAIGMTDAERANKEEQLGRKQQKLMEYKDDRLSKMEEEKDKSSVELYSMISDFLKRHKNNTYNYVLGYQHGGGILFANDSLNITQEVIDGLNKEYRESKKEKK